MNVLHQYINPKFQECATVIGDVERASLPLDICEVVFVVNCLIPHSK